MDLDESITEHVLQDFDRPRCVLFRTELSIDCLVVRAYLDLSGWPAVDEDVLDLVQGYGKTLILLLDTREMNLTVLHTHSIRLTLEKAHLQEQLERSTRS